MGRKQVKEKQSFIKHYLSDSIKVIVREIVLWLRVWTLSERKDCHEQRMDYRSISKRRNVLCTNLIKM